MKTKFKLDNPGQLALPSGTANAYDAIYIIAEALKIAGSFDRTKMRDALYKVKYDGIIAKYDPAFEKTVERHDSILPTPLQAARLSQGLSDGGRADALRDEVEATAPVAIASRSRSIARWTDPARPSGRGV